MTTGPIPLDDEPDWEFKLLARARRDVGVVLSDFERSCGGWNPVVEVPRDRGATRIIIDGSFVSPSATATSEPELLVEIASYIQSHAVEHLWSAWPVCVSYSIGLHPEVHGNVAVWWCKIGAHVVAHIGELPGKDS